MTVIKYIISIFASFALGSYATRILGFYDNWEIGIINMALMCASVAVGVIAVKCIRNHHYHYCEHEGRAIVTAVLCFLIPGLALVSNLFLTAFPGQILALILKYLFLVVYLVIGIIPSLILNAAYAVLQNSETVFFGVCVLVIFILPSIEGVLLGNALAGYKSGSYRSGNGEEITGRAEIVDSNGDVKDVFFYK